MTLPERARSLADKLASVLYGVYAARHDAARVAKRRTV